MVLFDNSWKRGVGEIENEYPPFHARGFESVTMSLEPIYEIERDAEGLPLRMFWCGFGPSQEELEMTWREASAPIIAKVIAETKSTNLHLLKTRLREAYPWGQRKYHPYRIWLSEIERQLHPELSKRNHKKRELPNPDQKELFTNV